MPPHCDSLDGPVVRAAQRALEADLVADEPELLPAQVLGRDIDEVGLGRFAVNPENIRGRCVVEALEFAHRLGEHLGIIVLADDPVTPVIFFEERRCQFEKSETTPALPLNRLCNSSWIFTIQNLLHARHNVGHRMATKLYHYPTPVHLVCNCPSSTRACE